MISITPNQFRDAAARARVRVPRLCRRHSRFAIRPSFRIPSFSVRHPRQVSFPVTTRCEKNKTNPSQSDALRPSDNTCRGNCLRRASVIRSVFASIHPCRRSRSAHSQTTEIRHDITPRRGQIRPFDDRIPDGLHVFHRPERFCTRWTGPANQGAEIRLFSLDQCRFD